MLNRCINHDKKYSNKSNLSVRNLLSRNLKKTSIKEHFRKVKKEKIEKIREKRKLFFLKKRLGKEFIIQNKKSDTKVNHKPKFKRFYRLRFSMRRRYKLKRISAFIKKTKPKTKTKHARKKGINE